MRTSSRSAQSRSGLSRWSLCFSRCGFRPPLFETRRRPSAQTCTLTEVPAGRGSAPGDLGSACLATGAPRRQSQIGTSILLSPRTVCRAARVALGLPVTLVAETGWCVTAGTLQLSPLSRLGFLRCPLVFSGMRWSCRNGISVCVYPLPRPSGSGTTAPPFLFCFHHLVSLLQSLFQEGNEEKAEGAQRVQFAELRKDDSEPTVPLEMIL